MLCQAVELVLVRVRTGGMGRRRGRAALALAGILGTLSVARLSAQTREAAASNAETLSTRSTLVVVPTLVRDKSGGIIFTLSANDFTLTDDGVPQKITLEEDTGTQPLALVVVIEADAATRAAGW